MNRERFVRITSEFLYAMMLVVLVLWPGPARADTVPPSLAQWRGPVVTIYVRPTLGPNWGVDAAIARWNSVGVIQLVRVSTAAEADITVRKVAPLNPVLAGNGGTATYAATDGYFNWCTVNVARDIYRADRRHVMTHELGHCMGLLDNYAADSESSVMSYADIWGLIAPTSFDVCTLRIIYATPPPPPVVEPAPQDPQPTEPDPSEGSTTP